MTDGSETFEICKGPKAMQSILCLTPLGLAQFGTEKKGGLGSGPRGDVSRTPAEPRPCVSAGRTTDAT